MLLSSIFTLKSKRGKEGERQRRMHWDAEVCGFEVWDLSSSALYFQPLAYSTHTHTHKDISIVLLKKKAV